MISDARARLWAQGWVAAGNTERGAWASGGGTATWQLAPWTRVELSPSVDQSTGTLRWIDTATGSTGPTYLFAETLSSQQELTLRGSLLASPHLSVQLYGQLLHYSVDYRDKLRAPRVEGGRIALSHLVPAPHVEDAYDPSGVSLLLNAVLRWEYSPGSVLWLVYSTSLGRADDRPTPPCPARRRSCGLAMANTR